MPSLTSTVTSELELCGLWPATLPDCIALPAPEVFADCCSLRSCGVLWNQLSSPVYFGINFPVQIAFQKTIGNKTHISVISVDIEPCALSDSLVKPTFDIKPLLAPILGQHVEPNNIDVVVA